MNPLALLRSDSNAAWQCSSCRSAMTLSAPDELCCLNCSRSYPRENGIWLCAPGFSPSGFTEARSEQLTEFQTGHFWYPARERLLKHMLQRVVGRGNSYSIVELGCGSGRFLSGLCSVSGIRVGVDGHPTALDQARNRDPGVAWVHADVSNTPLSGGIFDVVASLDVLEHVEPIPLLREARRLVKPDGHLLLSVPAFPSLWSAMDSEAGHRCRYRIAMLKAELNEAGWVLASYTHYQFLLFPLLAFSRRMQKDKEIAIERRPPRLLGYALGAINQLEVSLFQRLSLPWGSSLIVTARKQATTTEME